MVRDEFSRWRRVVARSALAVSAVVVACGAPSAVAPREQPHAAAQASPRAEPRDAAEYRFLYADVQRVRGEVPARFSAELPANVGELSRSAEHPPLSLVRSRICRGDQTALKRVLSALERADAAGSLVPELVEAHVKLFRHCEYETELCEDVVRAYNAQARPGVKAVLLRTLTECGSSVSSIIEQSTTPDDVVVDWYFDTALDSRFPKLTDRFAQAITAIAGKKKRRELRTVGVALGHVDDPAVVALVQRLGKRLDSESRAWLAIGFEEHPSSAARELHRSACKHPRLSDDTMCSPPDAGTVKDHSQKTSSSVEPSVGSPYFEAVVWLRQNPKRRAELIAALTRCADRESDFDRRSTCFVQLAKVDWKAAHDRVAGFDPGESWWYLESRATLRDFESSDAMLAELARLGWTAAKRRGRARNDRPICVRDALESLGRVLVFDAETGRFPNEHDVLLAELAELAGPALEGAAFEETPPQVNWQPLPGGVGATRAPSDQPGRYRLRAYHRGWRYELHALDHGDWYDVEAVIGLLNVVLRESGSNVRYVVLRTDDQTVDVVLGPIDGLKRAFQAGWLLDGNANASRESGRAAEDAVFEKMDTGRRRLP